MHLFVAFLIVIIILVLAGCQNLGYHNMTPEQIRATEGTTTCTQYSGLYGKASAIALNQDDTRRGATSKGKVVIVCGEAQMSIESEVGVPVPQGATTTTTTTVVPPK